MKKLEANSRSSGGCTGYWQHGWLFIHVPISIRLTGVDRCPCCAGFEVLGARRDAPSATRLRARKTKEIAQRLESNYIKSIRPLARWRNTLIVVLVVSGAVAIVLFAGWRPTRTLLSKGPLSSPHALFEQRCEVCHANAFSRIPDEACIKCHDGPAHPAKVVDMARLNKPPACEQCHLEHRGDTRLTAISAGNCTACHRDLTPQCVRRKTVRTCTSPDSARTVTPNFRRHPDPILRPLKLNHAIHMPDKTKVIRNITLPMKCSDCHVTDRNSLTGNLIPVTFEQNP